MNYDIKPAQGWEKFKQHSELLEDIYDTFMPLANQADSSWHYMNFTSDTGILKILRATVYTSTLRLRQEVKGTKQNTYFT